MAGCLGSDDETRNEDGDDGEGGNGDQEAGDDDGNGDAEEEDESSVDDGGDDSDEDEESVGTAEITFLGETYTFDDASCEGSRAFPPENEQIRHRDVDKEIEFWVERYDPEESDVVEVNLTFPTGDSGETIGEVEAYRAETTVDAVEFELGSGTSGSLHLDPSNHMNDDVERDPDGGTVEWDVSC